MPSDSRPRRKSWWRRSKTSGTIWPSWRRRGETCARLWRLLLVRTRMRLPAQHVNKVMHKNLIQHLQPPGKRSHASLSDRLKKVEDNCRQKEEERVNLELELTEVKESLKKALSGGVTLGLTIEPRAGSSTLQVRTQNGWGLFALLYFTPQQFRSVTWNL